LKPPWSKCRFERSWPAGWREACRRPPDPGTLGSRPDRVRDEIFDQHVELYGRVDGLLRFLHEGYRQTDPRAFRNRARRDYSSPGGEADDEWFVDNLIGTVNIGAKSGRRNLDLALRVLPQAWWDRRTVDLAAATRAARPVAAADR